MSFVAIKNIMVAAVSTSCTSFLYNNFTKTPTNRIRKFSVNSAKPLTIMAAANVVPAIIVGGGRVGKALESMGNGDDLLIKRGESIPLDFSGPILVCTRNDDLEAVLQSTPQSRWNDLVFFQNGMLEPWLESKGLNDADQVLAYFAVSKLGEPPIDGKTDTNPEGLTAAYGKWGSAVASRLQAGGLSCKVLEKNAFQKQMLEKLIWICSFMLVGALHPGATVGVVEKEHRNEIGKYDHSTTDTSSFPSSNNVPWNLRNRWLAACARYDSVRYEHVFREVNFTADAMAKRGCDLNVSKLILELAAAAAAEKGLVFDDAVEERLCAYARAVSHFPTAVKEFQWRNGWFYSLSQKAISEGKPDPCPSHTAWLKELKVV